jgi:hypothetical protein
MMIKIWQAAALAALLAPTAALAQSGFNGTWKMDVHGAKFDPKPDVYSLKDGLFSCSSCTPPYSVKADGTPQPVTGSPYYDHLAVSVTGPNAVHAVRTKAGQVTGEAVETVSADGTALNVAYTDLTVPSSPVKGAFTAVRVGPAPAGAHPISGAWRQTSFDASDNGLLLTVAIQDGMAAFNTPAGQSYRVKLNGPPGPFVGDPGITTVSVASSSPNQLIENDYRDGKMVSQETVTLAPDGRTAVEVSHDMLHGTTSTLTWMRQ